ncbi:MAG: hypothetical protein GYA24_05640 [Candidatus Lokiarchaeota archaeon]|nr:hypothetical protein [Candidatus Lokiarchaeota archaeon]
MMPSLDDLHRKELAFATFAARLHDATGGAAGGAVDEALASEFATASSTYSRALNVALQAYAGIDYAVDPGAKAYAKARINYAYDFLALLVDIVKVLEMDAPDTKELPRRLDLLEELLLQKESIVASTYLESAKQELVAFHDRTVREQLEEKLARMIRDRQDTS